MNRVIRGFQGLVLGCVVLLGTGCASLSINARCPAEGGHAWHEVRSAHFVVKTNLDPIPARKAALDLERFRRALLLAWSQDFDPPGRLEVIVLRTRGQLSEFASSGYAGFTLFTSEGPVIVMDGGGDMYTGQAADRNIQAHELVHYLSRFVLVRQPRWFAEGLASTLETVALSKEGTDVVLGWPHPQALAYVRARRWMKIEELWSWDQDNSSDGDSTRRYASSWLWVYYLMNEYPERFSEFQARLARAEDPREAFHAAFMGVEELGEGLRVYVERGRFAMRTAPLPEVPSEVRIQELESAEVHAIRARLHLMGGGKEWKEQVQAAKQELTQGLTENPANVSLVRLVADFIDDAQERLKVAEALVEARPDSGLAWGLLARARRRAGSPAEVQEKAYVRAVELAPDDANAHNELAWFYVMTGVPQKGYESAVRAVQLAPYSAAIVDTYAAVLFGMGRCSRSINAQHRAVDLLHESDSEQKRKDIHGRLTQYETVCRERAAAAAAREAQRQSEQQGSE